MQNYNSNGLSWTDASLIKLVVHHKQLIMAHNHWLECTAYVEGIACSVEVILRAEAVEMAQAGDKCDFTGTLIVVPDVSSLSIPGINTKYTKSSRLTLIFHLRAYIKLLILLDCYAMVLDDCV